MLTHPGDDDLRPVDPALHWHQLQIVHAFAVAETSAS
jgi:hypothetical protein